MADDALQARGAGSAPASIHDTPERMLLREQVQRFVAREIEPRADLWEREGSVPREVLRRLGELGWLGLMAPEAFGGADVDAVTNYVFTEALSQSTYGGFVVTVLVHTDMASPHLVHAGSDEQKRRWLPGILRGDVLTAVAVTEADAGSDVARMRTRARRDGDAFVLDGSKMFITNGVNADLYFVAARTAPLEAGARGISMFCVERGTPGLRVGQVLDKAGWRSSDTAELVFDGCRIPATQLLGVENRGFFALMENFQRERLALAAMAIGNAQSALRLALAHVRERSAFGGVPVGSPGDTPSAGIPACPHRGRAQLRAPLRMAFGTGPRVRARGVGAEGAVRRARERRRLCLPAVSRRDGLYSRDGDRAAVARCANPGHRRRRDRGDARGSRQAALTDGNVSRAMRRPFLQQPTDHPR